MTLVDQVSWNEQGSVITSWRYSSWSDLQEKIRVTTHSPFRYNLWEAIEHTIVYKDLEGNTITKEDAEKEDWEGIEYKIDIATYRWKKPVEITVSLEERISVWKVFNKMRKALGSIFQ